MQKIWKLTSQHQYVNSPHGVNRKLIINFQNICPNI